MPELPEVETVCGGLAAKILYLKFEKVINHKLHTYSLNIFTNSR